MDWSLLQAISTLVICGFIYVIYAKRNGRTRPWPLRVAVGFMALVAIYLGGFSYESGWPSYQTTLPKEFIFVRGIVFAPTDDDPGKIYMWIRTAKSPNVPISIEVPFDEQLARDVLKANEMANSGEVFITTDKNKQLPAPEPKPKRRERPRMTEV